MGRETTERRVQTSFGVCNAASNGAALLSPLPGLSESLCAIPTARAVGWNLVAPAGADGVCSSLRPGLDSRWRGSPRL